MIENNCPDPDEYINSIKKPINKPLPDRVTEQHNRDGRRSDNEKMSQSTYYPMKKRNGWESKL